MAKERIIRSFKRDDIEFVYEIILSSRSTIGILIKRATKEVIIRLPTRTRIETAEMFIEQKLSWIVKHLNSIEERDKTINRKSYDNGSTHLFLGREYELEIIESPKKEVNIRDGKIVVATPKVEYTEPLLKKWYSTESKKIIIPICSEMSTAFYNRHKVSPASIEFKYIKSYWGVCTSKRVIRLNIELMRAPEECIRYIIAHELCHLVHPNHSKRFYDLLTLEYPRWKEYKLYLDKTISTRY